MFTNMSHKSSFLDSSIIKGNVMVTNLGSNVVKYSVWSSLENITSPFDIGYIYVLVIVKRVHHAPRVQQLLVQTTRMVSLITP